MCHASNIDSGICQLKIAALTWFSNSFRPLSKRRCSDSSCACSGFLLTLAIESVTLTPVESTCRHNDFDTVFAFPSCGLTTVCNLSKQVHIFDYNASRQEILSLLASCLLLMPGRNEAYNYLISPNQDKLKCLLDRRCYRRQTDQETDRHTNRQTVHAYDASNAHASARHSIRPTLTARAAGHCTHTSSSHNGVMHTPLYTVTLCRQTQIRSTGRSGFSV